MTEEEDTAISAPEEFAVDDAPVEYETEEDEAPEEDETEMVEDEDETEEDETTVPEEQESDEADRKNSFSFCLFHSLIIFLLSLGCQALWYILSSCSHSHYPPCTMDSACALCFWIGKALSEFKFRFLINFGMPLDKNVEDRLVHRKYCTF